VDRFHPPAAIPTQQRSEPKKAKSIAAAPLRRLGCSPSTASGAFHSRSGRTTTRHGGGCKGAGAGARPRAGGGQLRGRRALRAAPRPAGPRRRAAELGPHARQPLHLVPRHMRPRQSRHTPVRPPPPPPPRCSRPRPRRFSVAGP
jgi:hypothetical protein